MNLAASWNKSRRAFCIALTTAMLATSSCNFMDGSGLNVAGGKEDTDAKFAGTFYVELRGIDAADKNEKIIRNVGTIVDAGLEQHYVLILSLADVFKSDGTASFLPLFTKATLSLFQGQKKPTIKFERLNLQDGGFLVENYQENGQEGDKKPVKTYKHKLLQIGVQVVGSGNDQMESMKNKVAGYHLLRSQLELPNSIDLRNRYTSFVLIAIPKNHPKLTDDLKQKIPTLLVAEERKKQQTQNLKHVMVGFGETLTKSSEAGKSFGLNDDLSDLIKPRNFADVSVLENTPLSSEVSKLQAASEQLWEIRGSGLCSSSTSLNTESSTDNPNYDTGAAVYILDGERRLFAGFGVRSTAISAGYQNHLKSCTETTQDDMATLVVSVSKSHIEYLKKILTTQ